MAKAQVIDEATIKEMLHWFEFHLYDGTIKWKKRPGMRVDIGDEAGTINKGYRELIFKGKYYLTHRVLMAFHEWLCGRELPADKEIDHLDGNGLNNKLENLRIVSQSLNQRNRKKSPRNTTGVTGVHFDKRKRKYRARVTSEGKVNFLGYFDSLDEAQRVAEDFRADNGFTPRHGK